jgi:hypothetical protein
MRNGGAFAECSSNIFSCDFAGSEQSEQVGGIASRVCEGQIVFCKDSASRKKVYGSSSGGKRFC